MRQSSTIHGHHEGNHSNIREQLYSFAVTQLAGIALYCPKSTCYGAGLWFNEGTGWEEAVAVAV